MNVIFRNFKSTYDKFTASVSTKYENHKVELDLFYNRLETLSLI